MNTVITLLNKDWIRISRNPVPWIILFMLPLVVTFIMGAAFGGQNKKGNTILKILVVDEDQAFVGEFLKNMSGNSNSDGNLQLEFVDKDVASEKFLENKHNALLVIPDSYSEALFEGNPLPQIKLIKNPTQTILPHVVEDLLLTGIQALDTIRAPFKGDLANIVEDIKNKDEIDTLTLARVFLLLSENIKGFESIFFEPSVSIQGSSMLDNIFEEGEAEGDSNESTAKDKSNSSIFAMVLPMMASFFLFFGGESTARDIYREVESRNLQRYMSTFHNVLPLVVSKVIFAFSFIFLSSILLYVSGAIIFGISWASPWHLFILSGCYALFVAGTGFIFIALLGNEKRVQLWSNFFIFFMAFAGGSIFSADAIPGFVRNYITPFLPNFWYVSAVHSTQQIRGDYSFIQAVILLLVTGTVLVLISAHFIRKNIQNNRFAS